MAHKNVSARRRSGKCDLQPDAMVRKSATPAPKLHSSIPRTTGWRLAKWRSQILSYSSVSPLEWLRSQCPRKVARPLRNHLNCGIVGALMRGGAIGATLEAFPIPLGSTNISSAPIVAAFGRPPPKCPIAAEPPPRPPPPPPRANEAAGVAKTMNNAIATFTEVFDMGSSTNIH